MPINIAGVQIDKLSGPVSFLYLEPTAKMQTEFEDIHLPSLMLLGDHHKSTDKQCVDEKSPFQQTQFDAETKQITLGLMSTAWYRLLDTIATKERPIDYYIEGMFAFPLLKDHDIIKNFQRSYFLEDKLVMNYIPQYHLNCFTKNNKDCITQNIRYHFTDIRQNDKNVPEAVEQHFKHFYEETFYKNLYVEIFEWTDLFNPKAKLVIEEEPTLSFLDLLQFIIVQKRYDLAFKYMFHFENNKYQEKSLVFKQILKQANTNETYTVNKKPINLDDEKLQVWLNFVETYWQHHIDFITSEPLFEHLRTECEKALHEYITEYRRPDPILHSFYISEASFKSSFYRQKSKFIEKFYNQFKNFFTLLYRPVIELYYLLRSWKVTSEPNRSWLSIWNCGFQHAQNVAIILQKMNLYDIKVWTDTVGEHASRHPQVNPANNPTSYTPDAIENRCIQFNAQTTIDFSSINCAFTPSKISKLRIQLIGPALYLHILDGGHLTHQEILELVGNNNKKQKMIQKLFMIK